MMKEPQVKVGILFAPKIEFSLAGNYQISGKLINGMPINEKVVSEESVNEKSVSEESVNEKPISGILISGKSVSGKQVVVYDQGYILWQGEKYEQLSFECKNEQEDSFELEDVTIGIDFHWERKENQRFQGSLNIIVENDRLTAINVISVEGYLTSVISSEMSATASLELLKAHAVISRSWLLANMEGATDKPVTPSDSCTAGTDCCTASTDSCRNDADCCTTGTDSSPSCSDSISTSSDCCTTDSDGEKIKWYERDAHTHFDVCADDHCQRYQGITKASTAIVREAIEATRGEVLTYNGEICDARFSKCCGGAFEEFQYCWDNIRYPYLTKQRDNLNQTALPDLTQEVEAERWIRTSPEAFCNTQEKQILSQVLNNYDQETTDFYRWKVTYRQEELSSLIQKRSGTDYGQIIDLVPIARGTSGRLWKLKIVGTKKTQIIGKELEIRRTLSQSHLYSSAFVVDKADLKDGIPATFTLTGAGWGHGVGLCQIGAAVMGEQGHSYDTILLHYYKEASIHKLY